MSISDGLMSFIPRIPRLRYTYHPERPIRLWLVSTPDLWRHILVVFEDLYSGVYGVQCFWLYGLVDHNINPAKQEEDHQIIRLSGASTWLKSWPKVVACNPGPEVDRRIPCSGGGFDLSERQRKNHRYTRSQQQQLLPLRIITCHEDDSAVKWGVNSDDGCSCWSWWWYSTGQLIHVDCKSATRLWSGSPRCGRGGLWWRPMWLSVSGVYIGLSLYIAF